VDDVPRNAITFDIDWAPDWTIAACADACARLGVPATFFVTHDSPVVRSLQTEKLFECGIHPNFLPNSSQGRSVREVLEFCMDLVPSARAMRTHSLVQSSPLFGELPAIAPQIDIDVSLYLHLHPDLQAVRWQFDRLSKPIWRLPYYWEDDFAACDPTWHWTNLAPPSDGLRIFDFHPILVALNAAELDGYRELKRGIGGRSLAATTKDEVAALRCAGDGAATFLERLLATAGRFSRISDLLSSAAVSDQAECV
jgi:hypothetical protein